MKSMTTNLLITAAALAFATVASAQQYRADIPFAFRAGGKVLAPGTYTVQIRATATYLVKLTDDKTLHSILMLPAARTDGPKDEAARYIPALTFECGANRCALTRVWTGSSDPALMFPRPSLGKD